MREATSLEKAIELAEQVIQTVDKGDLDTCKVPIFKAGLIANRRTAMGPGHWEFTFRRHLHVSKMFYVWKLHSTEEID